MSTPTLRDIAYDGLWRNNPGLVQLLGLCPLLAVSSSVVNALGLGLATTLTLVVSNTLVSALRGALRPEIRIPVYVMIIAAVVSAIELSMNAYLHGLYRVLGLFIPLIVTNCVIIGRAEAFAARHPLPAAAADGLMMGLGFTAVLLCLGALREAIGQGTLLAHAELLFGPAARDWTVVLIEDYRGFLLAVLPPGAFLAMGLLIAAKNRIEARRRPAPAPAAAEAAAR